MVGYARDSEAVPVLVKLLNPHNLVAADAIIWALGEIGRPAALPALLYIIASDWLTADALEAVGKIGDQRAMPVLLPLLARGNETERRLSAEAIVRIIRSSGGDLIEEYRTSLLAILEDSIANDPDRETRYFALVAFSLLGGEMPKNQALAALGAVMSNDDMSAMSVFFVGRGKASAKT